MNEWQGAAAALAAALASLVGLTVWACAVPTRAWGEGAANASTVDVKLRAWGVALCTLLLQTVTVILALGWAAGIAVVLAAWMLSGWLLVLAMNQWPHASLCWARRLGWAGAGLCGILLIEHLLRTGQAM